MSHSDIHSSHTIEPLNARAVDRTLARCRRCGSWVRQYLEASCPGGGWDLHHPRPWQAEPMDGDRPHGAWQVTCPSKSGVGRDVVVTRVSELDAIAIAAAGAPDTGMD